MKYIANDFVNNELTGFQVIPCAALEPEDTNEVEHVATHRLYKLIHVFKIRQKSDLLMYLYAQILCVVDVSTYKNAQILCVVDVL